MPDARKIEILPTTDPCAAAQFPFTMWVETLSFYLTEADLRNIVQQAHVRLELHERQQCRAMDRRVQP